MFDPPRAEARISPVRVCEAGRFFVQYQASPVARQPDVGAARFQPNPNGFVAMAYSKMRIGISILTHAGQSVWENGLNQNVFFLAQLLRTLPMVDEVVLLNCGDQTSVMPEAQTAAAGFPLLRPHEALDRIDLIIEMGGALPLEWLDYARALGKQVVFMCCGQPYVALIEPSIFKRDGYFARPQRCDEVWILPKDRAFKPMLETLHRCPVWEVPFLWDPVFVETRMAVVAAAGFQFGYQPRRPAKGPRALRTAIFEPNISVVKNSLIPMLIGEHAYRLEPESVAALHVLNSVQMKTHPAFVYWVKSMHLYSDEKVHLDHRHDVVGYISQFADAVISHQWCNDQNILYLDVLYGGYPLIHNSPWLSKVGYYYPNAGIAAGAQCLQEAAHHHDEHYDAYLRDARRFWEQLSPTETANGSAYAQRLLHLCANTRRRLTC
ncbi:DUF2827 family protein [Burkholderia pyrrocinia]